MHKGIAAVAAAALVLSFSAGLFAQAPDGQTQPNGYRGIPWGASKTDMVKSEGKKADQEQKIPSGSLAGLEVSAYKVSVSDLDALAAFYFAEGKLTRGRYMIIEKHSNDNLYISDYNTIKEQIAGKYGKPKEDRSVWSNDLYKDDPGQYGFAVSLGHLQMGAKWSTPDTEIYITLNGDNYEISLGVEYTGTAFAELEKKTIEAAKKTVW